VVVELSRRGKRKELGIPGSIILITIIIIAFALGFYGLTLSQQTQGTTPTITNTTTTLPQLITKSNETVTTITNTTTTQPSG